MFKHILPLSEVLYNAEKQKGIQNRQIVNDMFRVYNQKIKSSLQLFSYNNVHPKSLYEYVKD